MTKHILIMVVILLPVSAVAEFLWNEHTIDGNFDGAYYSISGDVDGDGDPDVMAVALYGDEIAWYENENLAQSWIKHTVGFIEGPNFVCAADMDNDGDLDIVVNAGGQGWETTRILTIWENESNGQSWISHTLENVELDQYIQIHVADLNGDGNVDIIGTIPNSNQIAWWKNENNGDTWTRYNIDANYPNAKAATAADVDGDGDLDIVGGGVFSTEISWWENEGADENWTRYGIGGMWHSVDAWGVDVDNDGDIDVIAGDSGLADVKWWENLGEGTAWSEHWIDQQADWVCDLHPADMDGDGDMDLLGCGYGYDEVWLWENTDGGLTWVEHLVTDSFDLAYCVWADDFDQDGHFDILGAAANANDVTWWEQGGPLVLDLIPLNSPILIPPAGGLFWYSAQLYNSSTEIVYGLFHTEAILPNQSVFGPISTLNVAIAPGQTIQSPILTQVVPYWSPAGEYFFRAQFTPSVGEPVSDEFPFEKIEGTESSLSFSAWIATGWDDDKQWQDNGRTGMADVSKGVSQFSVLPNPFNGSTSVTLNTAERGMITVDIYDVLGRKVTTLHKGELTPGQYVLTWQPDGSAGTYFLRAANDQGWIQTQKLHYVK